MPRAAIHIANRDPDIRASVRPTTDRSRNCPDSSWPSRAGDTADAAMLVAATAGNLIHAQDILLSLTRLAAGVTGRTPEAVWDAGGARLVAA